MSDIQRRAIISECGQYRYRLGRTWNADKKTVLFVMLNPSTADAEIDDPTIKSCIRLCRGWGYGGFEVVNLFAWRATDPDALKKARDPVGPRNDEHIDAAVCYSDFTVCAWGAHKLAGPRSLKVLPIIRARRDYAHCLGVTKAGAPKHPLYIQADTVPEVYWP